MFVQNRPGQGAWVSLGLLIVLALNSQANASGNLWSATFGQQWFYESAASADQVLAGTWWESSLVPGKSYRITFNVKKIQGRIGVLVGGNPVVAIDGPGDYSFDFAIETGGKRRMLFKSLSDDVLGSVNSIMVAERVAPAGGGSNWIPKGHYLSFSRERDLYHEMVRPLEKPWTVVSDYERRKAKDLDAALRTPGLKGIWMSYDWGLVEVADGKFDWALLDSNMNVARQYGLKMFIKIQDRSFNGAEVLPKYFPSQHRVWAAHDGKSGFVAKRWSPWVYNRLIRLYGAIAKRYEDDPVFVGIATPETAMGGIKGGDYTLAKYRDAFTQIVTRTQATMSRGKLLLYLNFLRDGTDIDMRKDARVRLVRDLPKSRLLVGGPDITPDVPGMPGSVTAYRQHLRRTMPEVSQFCHYQHVDQGMNGINVKSNSKRQQYLNQTANVRDAESKPWFKGPPAIFEFGDLVDPQGKAINLHPGWVLGKLWQPGELFTFARRNFACDYHIWHYREHPKWNEFGWNQVKWVVQNNRTF